MSASIYEYVYDPSKGWDVAQPLKIDFDPLKHVSKESAAKAMHVALQELAERIGCPRDGVKLLAPDVAKTSMTQFAAWTIMWEEGPYEWAVSTCVNGPWGYGEPYNGFILTFVS